MYNGYETFRRCDLVDGVGKEPMAVILILSRRIGYLPLLAHNFRNALRRNHLTILFAPCLILAAGAAGGGGKLAAARRLAGNKVSILCEICKVQQPNFKSMTLHWENKHTKLWTLDKKTEYEKMFNEVRGSHAEKKKKAGRAKDKKVSGSKKGKKGKKDDDLFF